MRLKGSIRFSNRISVVLHSGKVAGLCLGPEKGSYLREVPVKGSITRSLSGTLLPFLFYKAPLTKTE